MMRSVPLVLVLLLATPLCQASMNTLAASQESLSGMISLDSDQIQLHQKPTTNTATAKKVPVRDESTPTFNNSS